VRTNGAAGDETGVEPPLGAGMRARGRRRAGRVGAVGPVAAADFADATATERAHPPRHESDDDDGPRTLAVDCGGSKIKVTVLDADAQMLTDPVRVSTPYPCPPEVLLDTITTLAEPLPAADRLVIGMPGVIRHGRVHSTPHYITVAGPFTPVRPDLFDAWRDLDFRAAAQGTLGMPTVVVNDAEVQGAGVISGDGFEVVLTLGTGLGCALFDSGRLLPKVELSRHPFTGGQTYDERLGNHARKKVGTAAWSARVAAAVAVVREVFAPDHLYVGGGNARRLTVDLGPDVTLVENTTGLTGAVRLWDMVAGDLHRVSSVRHATGG
jgi:polyphosphate glucokinase